LKLVRHDAACAAPWFVTRTGPRPFGREPSRTCVRPIRNPDGASQRNHVNPRLSSTCDDRTRSSLFSFQGTGAVQRRKFDCLKAALQSQPESSTPSKISFSSAARAHALESWILGGTPRKSGSWKERPAFAGGGKIRLEGRKVKRSGRKEGRKKNGTGTTCSEPRDQGRAP